MLKTRIALAFLLCSTPAFAAESITGTVTNKTNNKPSAGDDVVLIRLQQGMQESTRTKTDAKGHFTLIVPDEGIHLVRVTHDKANYFRPAPPGTQSVEVTVYDVAAKVKGVSADADVMRIQTDASGKFLKVVENFFIKNDSTPPLTQFSANPFEFTLPEGAVVEGSAALAPGGMPVQSQPVPLPEKGHYTFLFPIRPGEGTTPESKETRFQITYRVPYNDSFTFHPQPTLNTDTIAVMMPKSMGFKAESSSLYSPVAEETTAQTYVARSVTPGAPLGFTLTGKGELPRDTENPDQGSQSGNQAQGGVAAQSAPSATPGGGLGKPLDPDATNDPWGKYKWWILGTLALLLAAAAGVLLRKPTTPLTPATYPDAGLAIHPAAPGSDSRNWAPTNAASHDPQYATQQALKEEMFSLEKDRLQKKISEEEYQQHKQALDFVLLRALSRAEPAPAPATPPQDAS